MTHPDPSTSLPIISTLRSRVESLLLVSDEPVTPEELARVLSTDDSPVSEADARAALTEIADEFDARGSGFELRDNDGAYRLHTRRANSDAVEAKLLDGTQQRLSRAALETLAVVAYRQPVTRSQVAAVRGVNCDGVMRTLALRGLIAVTGEQAGANLYSTTEMFLEQLGIESLSQLPDLAPLLPDVDSIDD
ncbi:SMC-Scp complex subunit ScpB [Corynebacterium falsenii]|uniref:SMC-Scp complex subunit ScpB n=1 Tax=Corynebacterium falsenii TaxID=108486 RepID=A0A418Q4L9_9CORY|nr:SMC-Scp complex subunit ScpB [Corynebacterium falsenii]MDC7104589.1 SMC-Scp complex subunit ScpB [Corynebacterium falsenii]RIX33252.1 SMC-Scp complex subunit ScpB [Corynebacterium falsenii]UBI03750.1 SMC-Scp complex subunit ScpB [Corynebacterium falsenii]UBI06241.1 SMC-Scp complex subunit ScpB [Corynebacterium falsenii]HJF13117.1 SMC-Scp complex subunit ScpB [Corynebacterium falsenii]